MFSACPPQECQSSFFLAVNAMIHVLRIKESVNVYKRGKCFLTVVVVVLVVSMVVVTS
jgi:hypothetical protein